MFYVEVGEKNKQNDTRFLDKFTFAPRGHCTYYLHYLSCNLVKKKSETLIKLLKTDNR